MPRTARLAPGGYVFHVLNRGNLRARIFDDDGDYAAFEGVLEETLLLVPGVRLLAYCVMPDHWHLLLWPAKGGELGRFMQRLTVTHVRRWHARRHSEESAGHLYQGAYKSFPVQDDFPYLAVARYVERNPLRAGLVKRAEDWRWCSLWRRQRGAAPDRAILSEWPVQRPADWLARVNRPQRASEEAAVSASLRRGRPFGDEAWQRSAAKSLGLLSTFRDRGRPRKQEAGR
jgi:putative transposase